MSKQEQHRRRILDGAIGACVLALLYVGYSFVARVTRNSNEAHRTERPGAVELSPGPQPPANAVATAKPEAPVSDDPTGSRDDVRFGSAKSLHGPASSTKPSAQPVSAGPRTAKSLPRLETAPASADNKSAYGNSMLQPSLAVPVAIAALPSGAGSNLTIPLRSSRPAGRVPVVVPESTLNRQLDSPRLPAYASDPAYYDSSQRKYPRLLRRGTVPVFDPDPETVAALHTPEITGIPANAGRAISSGTMRVGVVRSACLGMMAGNLDYSPVPAYPTAAAAARIQGQVRIEATVERDGSVASARVISGPPLLREAALDAVQQWRYKPYVAAGKAKPAGTTAVLDFTLP